MRIGMSIASPAASANSNYRYQPEHDHQDDDQDEEAAAPPRIRGSLIPGTAPLVVTILLLLATVFTDPALAQSRNSSSPGRPRNRTGSTIDFSSNKVEHDDDDDDEYYLGHSGYLRSATSMIAAPSRLKNVTDYALYKISNSTHVSSKPSDGNRRVKRGVTHLYNMIVCATGCNPLAYKGYGCYCGFLGSGYPMDGIDRCCKMHDWCYDATDCPMFVEYFVPYYWKCYHGYKPICAIEHGEWGKSGSCAQRLCECDRAFAECLRRYPCPRHKAVCTSSPWRLIQNIFMTI